MLKLQSEVNRQEAEIMSPCGSSYRVMGNQCRKGVSIIGWITI